MKSVIETVKGLPVDFAYVGSISMLSSTSTLYTFGDVRMHFYITTVAGDRVDFYGDKVISKREVFEEYVNGEGFRGMDRGKAAGKELKRQLDSFKDDDHSVLYTKCCLAFVKSREGDDIPPGDWGKAKECHLWGDDG